MIDNKVKQSICEKAKELEPILSDFYGKIILNYQDGKFSVANVEQSIKNTLKERI